MIADGPKLGQDLAEMLSSEVQPNGFGAGIVSAIGETDVLQAGIFTSFDQDLRNLLTSATNRFISLQNSSSTNRARNELVQSISNVQTQRVPNDPVSYRWRLDLLTVDGNFKRLQGKVQTGG